MSESQVVDMGKEITVEQMRDWYFSHLDEYFESMVRASDVSSDERDVYELAVRAFINDLTHNGLPSIRRERYNRELSLALAQFGLIPQAQEMIKKTRGKRYVP